MLTLAGETPWWRCCGVKMRADFFGSKVNQKQASLKNNFVKSYLQDPTNSTISLDEPRPPTARLRRKVANILIWLSSPVQGPWEQIVSYLTEATDYSLSPFRVLTNNAFYLQISIPNNAIVNTCNLSFLSSLIRHTCKKHTKTPYG
eukprot:scaffold3408_cov98-Alexandrium_tamarense.AAC.1